MEGRDDRSPGPGMNAGGRGKQPSLAGLGRPRVLCCRSCRVYMQSGAQLAPPEQTHLSIHSHGCPGCLLFTRKQQQGHIYNLKIHALPEKPFRDTQGPKVCLLSRRRQEDLLSSLSLDNVALRLELVKPRPHYPIAQVSQAADVTPTPPSRVQYPRMFSVQPLLGGLERARKRRTKQKHGRIAETPVGAGRADAAAASMQVGTCCGRRSLCLHC